MIRSFSLQDILLVHKLQNKRCNLDLPEALIRPYHPLQMALWNYLFHWDWGAYTSVLSGCQEDASLRGFIQMRPRQGRPEWDIVSLAPALDGSLQGALAWNYLLRHACQTAGQQGALRLFAKAHDEQMEAAFSRLDFSIYAWEDILHCRLDALSDCLLTPEIRLRERQPDDDRGLQRLYLQAVPSAVQAAEGHPLSNSGHVVNPGVRGKSENEYVLEEKGEIIGYLALATGKKGYILRLMVHPDHPSATTQLLAWGASILNRYPAQSLYCAVRRYEEPIRHRLEDCGFRIVARQTLLVKQVAVRVMEPALKIAPGYETRVGAAPTHTTSWQSTAVKPGREYEAKRVSSWQRDKNWECKRE